MSGRKRQMPFLSSPPVKRQRHPPHIQDVAASVDDEDTTTCKSRWKRQMSFLPSHPMKRQSDPPHNQDVAASADDEDKTICNSGRKRQRTFLSSPPVKRQRHQSRYHDVGASADDEDKMTSKRSSLVIVTGLAPGCCTVLELKSRFEMFGCVSRLRIDPAAGFGYITFRSIESAKAAIASSLDPYSGITVGSQKVGVSWANDPLPQWRLGVGATSGNGHCQTSKLLQAEIPLSRYGRSNKKFSPEAALKPSKSEPDLSFKGRKIIAYDDLL